MLKMGTENGWFHCSHTAAWAVTHDNTTYTNIAHHMVHGT